MVYIIRKLSATGCGGGGRREQSVRKGERLLFGEKKSTKMYDILVLYSVYTHAIDNVVN
jgi:hypothetical protein